MSDLSPARFRRLGAIIIDTYAMLLPAFAVVIAASLLPPAAGSCLVCIGVFLCCGYLYCRDYLLGGRSIGKRLMGLSVVDRATGAPATGKQLLVLDLCFAILPFDAIVLLLTGRSIGERISGTAVVRGKVSGPIVKKRLLKVAAAAVVLGLALSAAVAAGLNAAKENESYALAYAYLTDSRTFAAREETDITLVGFSSTTHGTEHSHYYTFESGSHSYTVTCHPDGDGWAVCTDCTDFD